MKKSNFERLEKQKEDFNKQYKVGDRIKVLFAKGHPETFEDEIYNNATILGGHTVMTWLSEKGSYDISHVVGKV